jgi:2-polyprenyl-3-methyl-5-hydroxy-6-metoxy-1,4-benzoquinol methylase
VTWDGDDYQRRFDRLADSGHDVHGEATFVMGLQPGSVLDAGCGTGRVAIELARRGVDVVGVDVDASMLEVARERASHLEWVQAELTSLDLGRVFDVVVMAGNVPIFTPPGTEGALVSGCARHVAPSGALVAGFQLDRGFALADYDAFCDASGMQLTERYTTWDGEPFVDGGGYAVSVHRFARAPQG